MASVFLFGFGHFWHFMVFEGPEFFEGWGVLRSLALLIGNAFPMPDSNNVRFEY